MTQDASKPTLPPSALTKHFEFRDREAELYRIWEESGAFSPEKARDPKLPVFNIAMPPPNANGELHLGHSYGYTIMDIFGRFNRLKGAPVLLLPGKDHAGIQTQVVFEKKLQNEKVDIRSIPTSDLFERCYAFCTDRAQYMRAQEKRLALSADWSRELFTLDPRLTDIIYETFEMMWRDGLVYRGNRIINWSVFSQTGISDVEVEYKEQDGSLWFIRYPFADAMEGGSNQEIKLPSGKLVSISAGGLIVATTRPETMLGDTALVVHPEDERYQSLVGKSVIVPLVNRRIRIIADKRVDPTFGTGVVKVTPAHDFLDYDIGQDHKLEIVSVIGKNGKMTEAAGAEFAGLSISKCREAVIAKLTESGALIDEMKMKHKVPIGERGKDTIEPLISEQWWVNVDKPGNSLKGAALELLRSGKVKIYPARFQTLFEQWLENLRDWNISRQLWWGHRLPVWYKEKDGKQEIYVGRTAPKEDGWVQDKDTFDTWFSSGQWAYSTMSAQGLVDLKVGNSKHFPTHTMVMGRDILFFWACRMLLLTAYRLKEVPWKNIFFTGLVRDEHGQKMSKSKGNGIEPNKVIEKFGTDALRLALVMGGTPGNDINFSERKVEGYSKFINKLWNAAKLLEMKVAEHVPQAMPKSITAAPNRWILNELQRVHKVVTTQLEQYEPSIAADELYTFSWSVYCDWYLEMLKIIVEKGDATARAESAWTALFTFRSILTMLHPFVPYVTEELFQKLPFVKDGALLCTREWNVGIPAVAPAETIATVIDAVTGIRSVKAALMIPLQRIRAALPTTLDAESTHLIAELAKVDLVAEAAIPENLALRKPVACGIVVCEVEGKENYRLRLEKDLGTNKALATELETKLAGSFATQAKPDLVEKERERLVQAKRMATDLERELSLL
jgi:valyl-tRNA synthetase